MAAPHVLWRRGEVGKYNLTMWLEGRKKYRSFLVNGPNDYGSWEASNPVRWEEETKAQSV